ERPGLLDDASRGCACVAGFRLWKQSRQKIGRPEEGTNGTMVSAPHSEHTAACISFPPCRSPRSPRPPPPPPRGAEGPESWPPPCRCVLRISRHRLQRVGGWVSPCWR